MLPSSLEVKVSVQPVLPFLFYIMPTFTCRASLVLMGVTMHWICSDSSHLTLIIWEVRCEGVWGRGEVDGCGVEEMWRGVGGEVDGVG